MLAILPEALLHGAQQDGADPCLWLEQIDGKLVSVLWPYGYRAAVDPIRVVDAAGNTIATVGDRVELVGGGSRQRPDRCDVGESTYAVGSVRVLEPGVGTTPLPTLPESTPKMDDSIPSATLRGSREGDADPCLHLELEDGKTVSVLWPHGYSARSDPLRLIDPEGATVATVGDEIRLSGGAVDDRPDRCDVGGSTFAVGSIEVLHYGTEPKTPLSTVAG